MNLIFLGVLLILFFSLELAYFRIADFFNIIDKPNQRSSHTTITLRGGGVIFAFAALVYFVISGFQYPWFILGLSFISIISFADDIQPQSRKVRLLIHFISMGLMFYQWGLFSFPWYFIVLALIFSTGIINAYNFMDGINGITGGYSVVVLTGFVYINKYVINFVDIQLLYLILIALFVFNFFNFRKRAKCFAGDVGSVSIAFIIVFLLGLLILKTNDFSYIILLAVYGVDSILTIIHRLLLKENIFEPHRKHLYQLLANELKINHLVVSGIYVLLQAIISCGIIFYTQKMLFSFLVIFILSLVYILFKRKYYTLSK